MFAWKMFKGQNNDDKRRVAVFYRTGDEFSVSLGGTNTHVCACAHTRRVVT